MSIVEKQAAALENAAAQLVDLAEKCLKLREALQRIRDCDWPGPTLLTPSRDYWMQQIAREALE